MRAAEKAAALPICPDPVEFARDFLGITPWARQAEILRAARDYPRVAVRSGHKIGKSNSAAILALWWWATRPRAFVVMTSSTDGQVKEILWAELRRLYRNAKIKLGGELHESHRSGLRASDGRSIIGISTNQTENMGGFSGSELLFIVDEASGVSDDIFNAIEGNRAGGARIVMFGNPTQMSGRFYEAFHESAEFWHLLHVSSTETPNVIEGRIVIPGLAWRDYVEEKTRELGGPGNPEWDIRIGGNFPQQGENSVIGLGDVEVANTDWRPPVATDGPLEIGLDVARFGDDESVIWPRRGKYLYEPTVVRSMDGHELAEATAKIVEALRTKEIVRYGKSAVDPEADVEEAVYERALVKIDSIGVGASPYDILRHNYKGMLDVVAVDAGTAADADEDYVNKRAQLWFGLRDFLRDGGKFKADAKARVELIAPVYSFDSRNRKKVESKDDIKKKIKRSPDRADAMALAVYRPPKRQARQGSSYM